MNIKQLAQALEQGSIYDYLDDIITIYQREVEDSFIEEHYGALLEITLEAFEIMIDSGEFDLAEEFYALLLEHELGEDIQVELADMLLSYAMHSNAEGEVSTLVQRVNKAMNEEQMTMVLSIVYKLFWNNFVGEALQLAATLEQMLEMAWADAEEEDINTLEFIKMNISSLHFYYGLDIYSEQGGDEDILAYLQEHNCQIDQQGLDFVKFAFAQEANAAYAKDFLQRIQQEETSLKELELVFMKTMHKKGMSAKQAGVIWSYLDSYWYSFNAEAGGEGYFNLDEEQLQSFVNHLGSAFTEGSTNVVALLWGGRYVYEFLAELGMISEELKLAALGVFNDAINASKKAVAYDLWKYTFVHQWPKPLILTQEAWDAECEEFSTSFDSMDDISLEELLGGMEEE